MQGIWKHVNTVWPASKGLEFHSSLSTLPTQNAGKPLPPSTCTRITLTDKKANSHITEEKEP